MLQPWAKLFSWDFKIVQKNEFKTAAHAQHPRKDFDWGLKWDISKREIHGEKT